MNRYEGLLAETTSQPGFNDELIESYLARPIGSGPYPGVVVVHHNPGWDDGTKELTRRFAFEGYLAVCPNLFFRAAPEASADDAAAAQRAQGGVADSQSVGDIGGAVKFLRSLPFSNGKVGVIGFCSGGRQAYLAACHLDIDAVVDAHGGRVVQDADSLNEKMPVSPLNLTKDMRAPILGLFGEEDSNPSPEHMTIIEAELVRLGKVHEFHSYPGVGHEFMNARKTSYGVEAANDAWERILAFYGKYLAD